MARAYGANIQVCAHFETVYGAPPSGDWIKLPIVSTTLGAEQPLIANAVLGLGREPVDPLRDVIRDEGDVVVPVDVRNFGHWLKLLLGPPVTTGAGPYVHTFTSGAAVLPSLSLEIGMPEAARYFVQGGTMANTMALRFERSGRADATIGCIAQGETPSGTSVGGTPTGAALQFFSQFQGSIKKAGADLANVTLATLTYSNGLEKVEPIRPDGKIAGADPALVSVSGQIDVRFADNDLMGAATGGTPVDLELAYSIGPDTAVVFTLPRVFLPKPKLPIQGPGGIQAAFQWQASRDPVGGHAMTVVLKNDVVSYV
jgi:hypothetical protein